MTDRQPHKQRCDTCTNDGCDFNEDRWGSTWHNDIYYFMKKCGCASHSSASEPVPVEFDCRYYPICYIGMNLLYCPKKAGKHDCDEYISMAQHDERIRTEAAKAERERMLDVFAEVEYLHDVDGITYPDLYNEFIQRYKSLRSDQP